MTPLQIQNGIFVISLDFELYWGVLDSKTLKTYGENILGVHSVIPRILELFNKYDIHATWATVGFLFAKNWDELYEHLPNTLPSYSNKQFSPYDYISSNEASKLDLQYHFAPHLIRKIQQSPHQEIATHTFSHYYCIEDGQSSHEFSADLDAAINIAKKYDITLRSIVFPRNQFNEHYLKICSEKGITSYRGNEQAWVYSATKKENETKLSKIVRLFDTYINITGHHIYQSASEHEFLLKNIPSSRFLRPYSRKLRMLEPLKCIRIKTSLSQAAIQNKVFHLWWHPHNFGVNQNENLNLLEELLDHYQMLNRKYGFTSLNMGEIQCNLK